MKKYLSVIVFLIISTVYANAQSDQAKANDEKAMRANVAQMMAGWNAKNGGQFAKPFAADADYVIVNGNYIKGRTQIDKSHQYIFDTIYKNSNLTLEVVSTRLLKADVALVHVRGSLEVTESGAARTSNVRISLVMTKNGDVWEIAAFQNTRIEQAREEK